MSISRNTDLPNRRTVGGFAGLAVTLTRFDLWQAQANWHNGLDHMKPCRAAAIFAP
jgi:hypothetical protein